MSECLHYFETPTQSCVVALPFQLDVFLDEWRALRAQMIRECPAPFSRDEWAYLITFLDPTNLRLPFVTSFGTAVSAPTGAVEAVFRPRGPVAVWLPSNVSLLGPLFLVLLSLTGNPLRLKASSQAEDLTGVLLEFARARLPKGPLRHYLEQHVLLQQFGRDDKRNQAMAAEASVRVVFGSDLAVTEVNALPHPVESTAFAFSDRQSQAWVQRERTDDDVLSTLIRIFAIYGQAGCTAPRRVIVLDGSLDDCRSIRDRLHSLWGHVIHRDPPMHVASCNVMARQQAAASGWDAVLTARHGSVLAIGGMDLPHIDSLMALAVVPATVTDAAARLPTNIQTIGHALRDPHDPQWLKLLATTRIKRFVPIGQMHHFGATWDGWGYWQQMFEEVRVTL